MNVTLLKYDPDALDLLVMTKQTRLGFTPTELDAVRAWPLEKKMAELNYMLGTIESSWEFADYVFLVSGVSRAFTHQFVRTREGSYAQQSQRTVDMTGFDYVATGTLSTNDGRPEIINSSELTPENYVRYNNPDEIISQGAGAANVNDWTMFRIDQAYGAMIRAGVPPQDARGILPTNVATAIIGKFNLRTLSHMAALRLCTRTQGEYQDVFQAMRAAVVEVHPWAEPFLRVHCARHGVCAFPHYKECPIKGPIFNPDTASRWDEFHSMRPATRDQIQESWVQLQRRGGYEAKPKHALR